MAQTVQLPVKPVKSLALRVFHTHFNRIITSSHACLPNIQAYSKICPCVYLQLINKGIFTDQDLILRCSRIFLLLAQPLLHFNKVKFEYFEKQTNNKTKTQTETEQNKQQNKTKPSCRLSTTPWTYNCHQPIITKSDV